MGDLGCEADTIKLELRTSDQVGSGFVAEKYLQEKCQLILTISHVVREGIEKNV